MGKVQVLLIIILNILSLSSVLADSVKYEGIFCLFCEARRQIRTSKPSIYTSYGNKRETGSFNNKGVNQPAEFSYSYESSNTRKFSAGLNIGFNILGAEVKASLGGELQWTKTEKFIGKQTIPANKVGHAYITDRITTAVFRHTIQEQQKISGRWKNRGPSKSTTSKVITTTPELKIEIKDN